MLNNCSVALQSGRYTWRHNSIMYTICHFLKALENLGFELFADLDGFKNPAELFNSSRPDIAMKIGNELYVIELTSCYETNFTKSRDYKIKRYSKLTDNLNDKNLNLRKMFIEVSSLGFLPKEIREFRNFCKQFDCINITRMLNKISEVTLRCSYFIYNKRNSIEWENPELLKFY